MKKFLLVFLLLSGLAFGQGAPQFSQTATFSSAGSSTSYDIRGRGLAQLSAVWQITNGTVSACSFRVTGSRDGTNFISDSIAATTCTSDGQTVLTNIGTSNSYVRITLDLFTASANVPTIAVTLAGWSNATGGGGSSTATPSYSRIQDGTSTPLATVASPTGDAVVATSTTGLFTNNLTFAFNGTTFELFCNCRKSNDLLTVQLYL